MADSVHVVCPECDGINRVPPDRLADGAKCGKCSSRLFDAQPLALSETRFARHIERNDIPVLVDYWAPWCGPCRMMAPAFEQAAAQLDGRVRLVKVNTEEAPNLGARFGIRSIPTMALFRGGREVDRTSGAMGASDIVAWTLRNLG